MLLAVIEETDRTGAYGNERLLKDRSPRSGIVGVSMAFADGLDLMSAVKVREAHLEGATWKVNAEKGKFCHKPRPRLLHLKGSVLSFNEQSRFWILH